MFCPFRTAALFLGRGVSPRWCTQGGAGRSAGGPLASSTTFWLLPSHQELSAAFDTYTLLFTGMRLRLPAGASSPPYLPCSCAIIVECPCTLRGCGVCCGGERERQHLSLQQTAVCSLAHCLIASASLSVQDFAQHFTYPHMIVSDDGRGPDLLVVMRATAPPPDPAAPTAAFYNNHNSNAVSFHRVRDFRQLANVQWAAWEGEYTLRPRAMSSDL